MNGLTLKTRASRKNTAVIFVALLLISYGIFNARNLIIGPTVKILSPVYKEMEAREKMIKIKGEAKNMTYLSLNQKQIFVDTEGVFEEKLLLLPGSNTIEIKATDRFKNETVKTIKVYYVEDDKLN